MRFRFMILLLTALILALPAFAQEATPEVEVTEEPLPVEPQTVEVRAEDRLRLYGDFYLVDPERPTVILFHELYTNRTSWNPLLRPLLGSGYNVLAIDIRGWGATRGGINWYKAIDDVSVWTAWLREEVGVRPDAIHMMGSSSGSVVAIHACANDALCRSAIAISSPFSLYGNLGVEKAVSVHPVLVVYAERDRYPALAAPLMLEAAPDTVSVYTYEGNTHGKYLINEQYEHMVGLILEWLATHSG